MEQFDVLVVGSGGAGQRARGCAVPPSRARTATPGCSAPCGGPRGRGAATPRASRAPAARTVRASAPAAAAVRVAGG